MANLTGVNLANNDVTDIGPLRELRNLVVLDLSHNQIREVQPLRDLTNVLIFNISNNQISDLSFLVNLPTTFLADSQWLNCLPVTFGDFTQGIFIRNQNGQTPSLTSPNGIFYYPTQGILAWLSPGQNSISWNEGNFSGTITQFVN